MAKQQRKRRIPKIMTKKMRGIAADRIARINGVFKKLATRPTTHKGGRE